MQNANDPSTVEAKRKKYMPMVEFSAKVAIHQIQNGRFFTLEILASSKMWYTKCFERLVKRYMVNYETLTCVLLVSWIHQDTITISQHLLSITLVMRYNQFFVDAQMDSGVTNHITGTNQVKETRPDMVQGLSLRRYIRINNFCLPCEDHSSNWECA